MCLNFSLWIWLYARDKVASLSQWMDTWGIGLGQIGISISKFLNHSASLQQEVKAINSAAMVESAIQVCFFEPHEITPPPRLKIQPLVDVDHLDQ